MPHPVRHVKVPRFKIYRKPRRNNLPGLRRRTFRKFLSGFFGHSQFHQADPAELCGDFPTEHIPRRFRAEQVGESVHRQESRKFLPVAAGIFAYHKRAVQARKVGTPLPEEPAKIVAPAVRIEQRPDLHRLNAPRRKLRKLLRRINALRHSSANALSTASASFAVAV